MTVAKSAERSVLTVESDKKIERVDSVVVEQRDTLREVITQTIMTNDKGDTLKVTQVIERDQLRSRYDVRHKKKDVLAIRDTVYVVTRDSVLIQNSMSRHQEKSTDSKQAFVSALRWIMAIALILLATVVLVRARR
ncbi:MAG: hypothetical protein IKR89_03720 [Bacteroidaceae bacterium]|nr:hypothetical protein [Bacteroidaceae bacterium]